MHNYLKGGCLEHGAGLFSVLPGDRTGSSGHKLKNCEGDRALKQGARKGCGVSYSGDNQNLPSCCSLQCVLDDPAWQWGWTRSSAEAPSNLNRSVILSDDRRSFDTWRENLVATDAIKQPSHLE